jgi:hypothetical protein
MARMLSVFVLLLLSPTLVFGQRTKSIKPIPGTTQEYTQLKSQGEVVGTLANLDTAGSSNKSFALDLPYLYAVAKNTPGGFAPGAGTRSARPTNYQSQLATLQRQYQQAMNVKNPVQREQKLAQIMARMQQVQAQMVVQQARLEQQMLAQAARIFGNAARNAPQVAVGYKEFDMEAIEKIVVRRSNPPFEYDNKGNIKTWTKEELDRLRGKDKTLPGYEASFLDLQAGQTIKVYLVKNPAKKVKKEDNADDPDKKPAAKDDRDDKDKKDPNGVLSRDLPQVRMILILAEAPDADSGQDQTKKKRAQ